MHSITCSYLKMTIEPRESQRILPGTLLYSETFTVAPGAQSLSRRHAGSVTTKVFAPRSRIDAELVILSDLRRISCGMLELPRGTVTQPPWPMIRLTFFYAFFASPSAAIGNMVAYGEDATPFSM